MRVYKIPSHIRRTPQNIERGAHTCIEMFVKRVLISVPQHSLLTIKWLQTVYLQEIPRGDTIQALSFTPFSGGLLHIVTIYLQLTLGYKLEYQYIIL